MKLIDFTQSDGDPVSINPAAITAVEPASEEASPSFGATLWVLERGHIAVRETPLEISAHLAAAEAEPDSADAGRPFPYHPDTVRFLEVAAYLIESGGLTVSAIDRAAAELGGASKYGIRFKELAPHVECSGSLPAAFKGIGFPDFIAEQLDNTSTQKDLAHRFRLARSFILNRLAQ